jgi:hypothetical protein
MINVSVREEKIRDFLGPECERAIVPRIFTLLHPAVHKELYAVYEKMIA